MYEWNVCINNCNDVNEFCIGSYCRCVCVNGIRRIGINGNFIKYC